MPSYSHDYKTITEEPVQNLIDYIGGTDKNYAKTQIPIVSIVKVQKSGVDITPSCSLSTVGLDTVIVFGSPSILTGLVVVDYTWGTGTLRQNESIYIERFNVGGTPNNYFVVKEFPIKDASITLVDGDGDDVTSYITSIDGEGREKVFTGNLPKGKYLITYDWDAGEAGGLWRDNYTLTAEITSLEAFVSETNTKYQDQLTEALSIKEAARLNYRLWLKRLMDPFIPDTTTIAAEASAASTAKSYWNTNEATAMDSTIYQNLFNYVFTVMNLLEIGGVSYESYDNKTSKAFTYLSQLAELDNTAYSYSLSSGNRFDYGGVSIPIALSGGELAEFSNGSYLAADSYSASGDYSLRLILPAVLYIVGMEFYVVPSDNTDENIDHLIVNLSDSETLQPFQFYNDSDYDKQIENKSFKSVLDYDTNKYNFLKFFSESLKDEDGAPVSKDAHGSKFEHKTLKKRTGIYLYKKSSMTLNYISDFKIYIPSTEIEILLDAYYAVVPGTNTRVITYGKALEFVEKFTDVTVRIGAWSPITNYGVSTTGTISIRDDISFFNAASPSSANKTTAWGFVKGDIDSIINASFVISETGMDAFKATWDAELTSEGISTDPLVVQTTYEVWKKKYESAQQSYLSAYNAKNTKESELMTKQQILEAYGTLPPIN